MGRGGEGDKEGKGRRRKRGGRRGGRNERGGRGEEERKISKKSEGSSVKKDEKIEEEGEEEREEERRERGKGKAKTGNAWERRGDAKLKLRGTVPFNVYGGYWVPGRS